MRKMLATAHRYAKILSYHNDCSYVYVSVNGELKLYSGTGVQEIIESGRR